MWVGAGLFAQTGTSPGLDAALALDLGIELGMHSVALGAAGWLPRTLDVSLEPGNRTPLELNRVSVQLQDCLRHNSPTRAPVGHWGLGGCLNVGYHVVSSHFPAGTQPRDYRSWTSAGASFSALRKLSEHLVVEGQLGLDLNIAATPITAQPFGTAHEFGTIAGFVGTRMSWVFDPARALVAEKNDRTHGEHRESAAVRSLTDRNAW
jgi:hypothetical protein